MPKASSPQAFLITGKSNIRYLSNFTGSSGFILLTKNSKYLFTDFRYIERAKNTIKKGIRIIDTTKMWRNPEELKKNWQNILKKHRITNLGVEENNLTVTLYKKFKKISPKIKFIDCSGKIEKLREIKSDNEIKLTLKSQRINEKILDSIKKIIQESLKKKTAITENEIAWKIRELAHKFGAEDLSFEPIVAFGENSASPHHSPTDRKLKKGDLVLIDMGVKYRGYCSDMTRVIFTKPPTKKQQKIYNIVLQAQKNAIKNIKAGTTGACADNYAREIIEKAGFGEYFGHGSGHGTGLDIHELPSLSHNYKDKIRKNSIITIEPGIYLPGEFGIRIEDMLLVKKNDNRNLTKAKK